jgi:hypothetical protein
MRATIAIAMMTKTAALQEIYGNNASSMTNVEGDKASSTTARCLRTGDSNDTIVTRATTPPQ